MRTPAIGRNPAGSNHVSSISGMRLPRTLRPYGIVLLALAALVPLAAFDPATTWWFPPCPFHALTGWLCPLCGSLRAMHALLTGAPLAALAFNPLTIVGLVGWMIARSRTAAFCFSARGLALLAGFGLLRNL
jgi:hypothetical protein